MRSHPSFLTDSKAKISNPIMIRRNVLTIEQHKLTRSTFKVEDGVKSAVEKAVKGVESLGRRRTSGNEAEMGEEPLEHPMHSDSRLAKSLALSCGLFSGFSH